MCCRALFANLYLFIFFLCTICAFYDFRVLGADELVQDLCRPWSSTGPACKHLERLDLRFVVDVASENYPTGSSGVTTAVYGFAPQVDKLQLFSLSNAALLASVRKTTSNGIVQYTFSSDSTPKYLSVYGFGNSNNVLTPERGYSDAAVLLTERNLAVCGGAGTVAVVTILRLDVGLHKGLLHYKADTPSAQTTQAQAESMAVFAEATEIEDGFVAIDAFAEEEGRRNHRSTRNRGFDTMAGIITVKRPLKAGFAPTCGNTKDGERCLFDPDQICVGEVGHRNCARCYKDAAEVANLANLWVVTSYYGTDAAGRTLTSGTTNPLNFREFGSNNIFKDMQKAFKG